MSPSMCRRSVLLPLPLPPMMTNTSLRRTVKSMSRMRTKSPKAMVRSRTVMWAFGSTGALTSDSQDVEGDGEDAAGADDEHDPRHHRGGGRLADGRGAAAALEPTQASRHGDEDTVHGGFEHAAGDVAEVDR